MFFEFLNAAITLDLSWLATLVLTNLHYLFLIGILCFFFWGPSTKKVVISTILLSVVLWTWADLEFFSGWAWALPLFLGIYYISKLAIVAFAENTPGLSKHLVLIQEVHFIGLFAVFNIFIV